MKHSILHPLLAAAVLILTVPGATAATEQQLIQVLSSAADIPAKAEACRELRVVGTPAAVPSLAALLPDDRLNHAARYALEGLPGPEAKAALRKAFQQLTGSQKAGVVLSLGALKDAPSVALISPALLDSNPEIATAAAQALGSIAGKAAASALQSATTRVAPSVLPRVHDALLKCAEMALAARDSKSATQIYDTLAVPGSPEPIRLAAWRGQLLAASSGRDQKLFDALMSDDLPLREVALKAVRELSPELDSRQLAKWKDLPLEARLAFLEIAPAHSSMAARLIPQAISSQELSIRVAAWRAAGEANHLEVLPLMAQAAATAPPAEQLAAREALTRLHGESANALLRKSLNSGPPAVRAAVANALGARDDAAAVPDLIDCAREGLEPVSSASLEALGKIRDPKSLSPLLQIAFAASSSDQAEPVLAAAASVLKGMPDKETATQAVLASIKHAAAGQRVRLLPLLPELGTTSALEALLVETRNQDSRITKTALDALCSWPNAAAAQPLLEISRTTSDPATHSKALRGAIEASGNESDPKQRLNFLHDAMAASRDSAEKKLVLSQVAELPTAEALELAASLLSDNEVATEAGLASLAVAARLAAANPALATATADRVLASVKSPAILERAWSLRGQSIPPGGFIRDWLVAGPYQQTGADSALAVFPIAFPPEKGEPVSWKTFRTGDSANLLALFPGAQNSAAYLKATIISPAACDAMLLLGSDDGLKAWVNGVVIHSNNIDRGEIPDQDKAAIRLQPGTNDLLLKITQGGGGWSACARIVGADGKPVPGLRIAPAQAQTAATPVATSPAPTPAPEVAPVPSTLPARDKYRKLRLTEQFHAEGAHYADFNADGRMDIVAGPFWFAGPDFQKRFEYRPVKIFNPATEYSDNFLTFAGDMNGDGRPDILCVPFPGKEGYWYENPGQQEGHWKQRLAYNFIGNESPVWGEIIRGSGPQLLFCDEGYLGYAGPDISRPDQPWKFHPVSQQDKRYQRFTHGAGLGDLNGDNRIDVLESIGWWEQPDTITDGQPWKFHPFKFAEAGAQILVTDVDGDSRADVITAWHCHAYGLVWWQQSRTPEGRIDWKKQLILPPEPDLTSSAFRVSQLHALQLVDMNGDGIKDILTGKRFWSHGPTGDKEPAAPALIFWLELRRNGSAITFLPHLIDDDSGVGTQVEAIDLNGDQRPDPVVANKKGIFVHLSTVRLNAE